MAIKERHWCKRLTALQLPKDALEHRTEHLGRDRVKDGAHMCVTRDAFNAVDGVQIAFGALFVKAAADQAKEGIGGEMLPYGRHHNSHGKPHYENNKNVPVRGFSHQSLRK